MVNHGISNASSLEPCRISKLVAENVGRNNPFLEDLGSQNRSMKIAERFRGDLYGDIWCDTLELLVDDNVPEEEALKAICDTLLVRLLHLYIQYIHA